MRSKFFLLSLLAVTCLSETGYAGGGQSKPLSSDEGKARSNSPTVHPAVSKEVDSSKKNPPEKFSKEWFLSWVSSQDATPPVVAYPQPSSSTSSQLLPTNTPSSGSSSLNVGVETKKQDVSQFLGVEDNTGMDPQASRILNECLKDDDDSDVQLFIRQQEEEEERQRKAQEERLKKQKQEEEKERERQAEIQKRKEEQEHQQKIEEEKRRVEEEKLRLEREALQQREAELLLSKEKLDRERQKLEEEKKRDSEEKEERRRREEELKKENARVSSSSPALKPLNSIVEVPEDTLGGFGAVLSLQGFTLKDAISEKGLAILNLAHMRIFKTHSEATGHPDFLKMKVIPALNNPDELGKALKAVKYYLTKYGKTYNQEGQAAILYSNLEAGLKSGSIKPEYVQIAVDQKANQGKGKVVVLVQIPARGVLLIKVPAE